MSALPSIEDTMMGFITVTCNKSKRSVIHSIKGFEGMANLQSTAERDTLLISKTQT